MGTCRGIPLWILPLLWGLLNAELYTDYIQETEGSSSDDSTGYPLLETILNQTVLNTTLTIIPVVRPTPVVKVINPVHNNRVCSTWGNFNFKNFDGDIFRFPGTCNYVYASHCKSDYEDFNIQIQRTGISSNPVMNKITIKINGVVVQVNKKTVLVDGKAVHFPYNGLGVQIESHEFSIKISSKLGLVLMLNDDNSLLLELDEKYANQTCGLCGDYNGISVHNEFIKQGVHITETQFGNLQKLDGPTEQCPDVIPEPKHNCKQFKNICENVLTSTAFANCHSLVDVEPYIEACQQDLCHCDSKMSSTCICSTLAEYSRQCAHAGGQPVNWRTKHFCPKNCPLNMEYRECGSACPNTCTNPERAALCNEHCLEGCYCPKGTVFDDVYNTGCIPVDRCPCITGGETYSSGESYSTPCSTCVCSSGKWNCKDLPCSSTCSVEGGSHVTTYDQTHYNIHGECNYVLTKMCDGRAFTVVTEIRKCGLSESESCLKSIMILLNGQETNIPQQNIEIKPDGSVYVNTIYTQLPLSTASFIIFQPTSFYIIVETNFGLQVTAQLTPLMQVYVTLHPAFQTKTCGLCGNFNSIQKDDFLTVYGILEGTAASFANSWKAQADCPNIKNDYTDPCSLSIENEQYASHWCGLISDPNGPFAACHSKVSPRRFQKICMFDSCSCEKSEDCMCAALSSYIRVCLSKGVILTEWQTHTPCSKYSKYCPESLHYTSSMKTCQPTCRSRFEPDTTCNIKFLPVDGCGCTKGFYMDDSGKCVPETACPCYYKGSAVPSGQVVHDNGKQCSCTQGQLNCIGDNKPECTAPMVYFDCNNAAKGTKGAECQKSCQILDTQCYRTNCVSGCVCPDGLLSDGKGGCIHEDQCPCEHNGATYQPGESIKVKCNNCTCKNRKWECTNEPCLGTCAVYGDGHYITFDGKQYTFNGNCEYSLVQDNCGRSDSSSSFRVITENIPCGTTGTTCSKAIKIYLRSFELSLANEQFDIVKRDPDAKVPYTIRYMGIYLVIESDSGLILLWDKKTSIFIKLTKDFEGKVCGLCGNYDGDGNNDFTTRSLSVVGDPVEFGNSWKLNPTCPDANTTRDPCSANPYRKSWAQKQCSIINGKAFSACHSQLDPSQYYDACVSDSCACDSGGDCECMCTAIAAYALACGEAGICVSWRTPSICPVFCDYYNPEGECEWHYKPCGHSCMKTCRNPTGNCLYNLPGLEGCYPNCPAEKPYFNEDTMDCVAQCGCYDDEGNHYPPGTPVPSKKNCQTCVCSMSSLTECKYDTAACYCMYNGTKYNYNDVIYTKGCLSAICKENGTILENILCNSTTPTTSVFSTTSTSTVTTSTPTVTPTICVEGHCEWSDWIDSSYPGSTPGSGDFETYKNIRAKGYPICNQPEELECRAHRFPDTSLSDLGQDVQCNVSFGLICNNKDQLPPICYNYEIRVKCCDFRPCSTTTTTATTTPTTTETTTSTTTETTTPTTTETTTPTTTETTTPTTTETTTPTTTVTTTPTTTTTSTTTETTTPTTTVTTTPTTTETTTPTTTSTTTETTTPITTETTTSTTETTTPTTTICVPKVCEWSDWIDSSYPGSTPRSGDFETYNNIRAKGYPICNQPEELECRAHRFPDTSLSDLGQDVQCNVSFGLICNNKDQLPPICYNYEIRVKCCYIRPCHTSTTEITPTTLTTTEITTLTTTGTTTPTTTETTTPTTTVTTTPTTTETTTPTTTETTTETTTPTTTETTISTTAITTTEMSTSSYCRPLCNWTDWIDVDAPGLGSGEGDFETYEKMNAAGINVCEEPADIQCRAEKYPKAPIDNIDQVVQCNVKTGFICKNEEQKGDFKECFNYQVKILCCDNSHCLPTTTMTTISTPISTTLTTTTSTTTPTVTPTTICVEEHCEWSDWIDKSYPEPTPNSGDFETYKNIRAKGYPICNQPEELECRAERFPDTSLSDLGQDVQCNVSFGLICNNKDQLPPICYNYEIRVKCCDFRPCSTSTTVITPTTTTPTTTVTTTPTTTTTSSTTETTTSITTETTTSTTETTTLTTTETTTPTTTETTPPTTTETTAPTTTVTTTPTTTETTTPTTTTTTTITTTPNTTETTPLTTTETTTLTTTKTTTSTTTETTTPTTTKTTTETTTTPTTTTTSTTTETPTTTKTTTETSTVSTTPITTPTTTTGCEPDKMPNESWRIDNCTTATCLGNNIVTLNSVKCPEVKELTCVNGFPPIKVYSEDGCCFHYECQCVCSGWGDPHYITFDGIYYTFLDNCTYVLVQQIIPKYDNFRVLVDNYFCAASDGLSCPQSIIIYYKNNEVLLTRQLFQGKMANRIRFNNDWTTPGFTTNGITVTSAGINMIVEIPEIGAYISFSGMIFLIKLPYSKFGYNTEGQCGTCSNNLTDECRLPDGAIVQDCSKMANEWKVNVPEKPYCNLTKPTLPPYTSTPVSPTRSTHGTTPVPPTCPPSLICNVILSEIFADCHEIIPPKHYYEGCVFDSCRAGNESMQCASLEVYASLCISNGVCVNWRNKTNGLCPYNCPNGMVYNACGPVHPDTCDQRDINNGDNYVTEGCYCPSGTTLFNSYSSFCVPDNCEVCNGPGGSPMHVGDSWTSGCNVCKCQRTPLSVKCEPLPCSEPEIQTCDKDGFVLEEALNLTNPCCKENKCVCMPSKCSNNEKSCPPGFQAVSAVMEGDCCPSFSCKPMNVCVVDNTVYQPGDFFTRSCDNCQCTAEKDISTSLNKVICSAIQCNKDCDEGYEYQQADGKCCGSCIQTKCIVKKSDNSTITLKPGESYTPDNEACTIYTCTSNYQVETTKESCSINAADCKKGFKYVIDEGQCCGKCEPVRCVIYMDDNSTKTLLPGETYTPEDDKCTTYSCTPNYQVTSEKEKCAVTEQSDCPQGYAYQSAADGECCGNCTQVACVLEMSDNSIKVLQPGETYTPEDDKCTTYSCTPNYQVTSEKEKCAVTEQSDCPQGYAYQRAADGECCGNCTQVACVLKMSDNSIKVLQPGETYTPEDDKCTTYSCTSNYQVTSEKEKCAVTEQSDCPQGYAYQRAADGECCGNCTQVKCVLKMSDNSIKVLQPGETYTPEDDKCTTYSCTPNYQVTSEKEKCAVTEQSDCPKGFKYVTEEGQCCGKCVPVACVMYNKDNSTTVIKPGETYTPEDDKCTTYSCTSNYQVTSEKEKCAVTEQSDCSQGYAYQRAADGECCGNCTQVKCVLKMSDNSIKVLQPGETYTPEDDKCTTYSCTPNYQVTSEKEKCAVTEQSDCPQGYAYQRAADGECCGNCTQVKCVLKMSDNSIKVLQPGETYTPEDDKCTTYSCTPNYQVTSEKEKCAVTEQSDCPKGFKYVTEEGQCCGKCVPVACVMYNKDNSTTVIKPGETYTPEDDKCTTYSCTPNYQVTSEKEKCSVTEQSDCPQGYAYQRAADGECCGNCTPVECVLKMSDNSIKVLQPGETYTPENDVCTIYTCTSDYQVETTKKSCSLNAADCKKGFKYVTEEGQCCGKCVPVACVMYNKDNSTTVIKPGETYTPEDDKCTTYSCTPNYQVTSEKEKCSVTEQSDCPQGFKYVTEEGQCCGKCVPVACVMYNKDNSTTVIKPGETYTPEDDKCTTYSCTPNYQVTSEKEKCAVTEQSDCPQGFKYVTEEGQCCGKCVPVACVMYNKDNSTTVIKPGETYTPEDDKCTTYSCTPDYQVTSEKEKCAVTEQSDCPQGYAYQRAADGECCGNCTQVACVLEMSDNSVKVLQPGETYTPEDDKCTTYSCTPNYQVTSEKEKCAVTEQSDCPQGYAYQRAADGECCETVTMEILLVGHLHP
ncbi:mucin-2-like isoform X2 [Xenopus tropicalis]|uniref:Mucin-2-like isoform X2 n=1 Tax=Xenopus tropicalis TaxID=8364 RepID=A0A8J1JF11_XENTR|nr:mucin-2-like isoform X2 [Xenopus tropicalis]